MRRISAQPKSSKQYLGISKKTKKIRMITQEKNENECGKNEMATNNHCIGGQPPTASVHIIGQLLLAGSD